MKQKIIFIANFLFILFGLVITDDLIQNNDEKLLMATNKKNTLIENDESFIIQIKTQENSKIFSTKIKKIANKYFKKFQLISPYELTKKQERQAQNTFYKTHSKLKLKLASDEFISFILFFKDADKRYFPQFFIDLKDELGDEEVFYSGLPYLNFEIGQTTLDIKTTILPILIISSLLLSLFIIKNLYLGLVFFQYPLLSIVISQLCLKYIYGETNLLSSLAPLVNFVVILTLCFHLFYGLKEIQSLKEFISKKMKPILFMIVTTIVGILSLNISPLIAIQQFALISSLALAISCTYTLLAFLTFNSDLFKNTVPSESTITLKKIRTTKSINLIAIIFPFLSFLFIMGKVNTQVEALYFFPQDSKVVKSIRQIENNLIGSPILEIYLPDLHWKEDYEGLKKIHDTENEIEQILGEKTHILSIAKIIQEANYIYTQEYKLPQLLLSVWPLLSQIPTSLKKITQDDKGYTISILHPTIDTKEYLTLLDKIEHILKKQKLKYEFRGMYYELMSSQSDLIKTLLQSFLISLIIVSLLVAMLFKTISDFFLFFIVNLIPSLLTYCLFYLCNLSLNIATITSFSVSFGLIVDATIHILYAQKNNFSEQMIEKTVMPPILFSAFILIFGFLTFLFHPFLPIRQFGLSMALTLSTGLIYDYFILPNLRLHKN